MLPPSVQFLASPDTPGPESPGRPLVAKIPGSHPPPGSSAALETIAQSLFSHDLRHRQYVREGEATGLPFSNFLHHLLTPGGYVLPGDLGHVTWSLSPAAIFWMDVRPSLACKMSSVQQNSRRVPSVMPPAWRTSSGVLNHELGNSSRDPRRRVSSWTLPYGDTRGAGPLGIR